MENTKGGGIMRIETNGDRSTVEITGTTQDIIFNWVALTHQMTEVTGILPLVLAATLPNMIEDYKRNELKGSETIRSSKGPANGMQEVPQNG